MKKKIFEHLRRSVAVLMAVLVFLCATTVPAYADDESVDTSFYKLASVASGFFSTSVSKNSGNYTVANLVPTSRNGNAGGFLGYSDNADESGLIEGWVNSFLSASSATFSYDSLLNIGDESDGVSLGKAYWQYCQKGRVLYTLGLDKTGTEGMHPIKWIAGNLMRIVYLGTTTVDAVFNAVINFLTVINPFRFFKPVDVSNNSIATEGVTGGFSGDGYYIDDTTSPELHQMAANIQQIYNVIYSNRIFILGALLCILAFSLAVSKGGNSWQKIRKFLIRACSITIAIPLLASFYTSCLGWMQGASQNSAEASARIVLSTYVDFEHWARDSHLALPSSISMKQNPQTNRLTPTDYTLRSLRSMAYAINTATNRDGTGGASILNATGSGAANDAIFNWAGTGATESRATVDYALDVLDRYANAEFYYASSFESDEKAFLSYGTELTTLIEQTGTTVAKFAESKDTVFVSGSNDRWKNVARAADGKGYQKDAAGGVNIWTNGDYIVSGSQGNGYITLMSGSCMSTMSMYNYLTSTFNDSSVIVYSNEKAPSGFTRQSHYSVNMVGTGMMAFLYWLNAMVMLGASLLIGWFYAFALFTSAIKRMVLLISSTPFALMGSLRAIARTIIYAIAMIAEICMTMIAYYLITSILAGLNTLVEKPLVDELATTPTIVLGGQVVSIGGVFAAVLMVALLISTIITILFVMMAMKVRTSLVKFVDELVTETVDAFIGVKSGADPGGSSSMGSKLAAGVGAGVGAGLAHKAMTSADSKSSSGADTQGVAVNKDKPDGGEDGNPALPDGGGGAPPALAAGDEASSSETNVENNISDDDTATAAFEGADTDDAMEIDAASSMTSLGTADSDTEIQNEAAEAGAAAAGADGSDGSDGQADAQAVQEAAEADQVVDTVEDTQNAAQAAGDDAGGAAPAGDTGAGTETGGDVKGAAVAGTSNTGNADGQTRKSGSVSEAEARNADSKRRLAQAQAEAAKAGVSQSQIAAAMAVPGQNGKPGTKTGASTNGQKTVAAAGKQVQNPHGTQPGQQGKPVAGAVANGTQSGAVQSGVAPAGAIPAGDAENVAGVVAGAVPAGALPVDKNGAPLPAGVQPGMVGGVSSTPGSAAVGVPAGAIPIGENGAPVAAMPGGQPAGGAAPVAGAPVSGAPSNVVVGGVAGHPSAVAGSVAGQPSVTSGHASVLAGAQPGVAAPGNAAGVPAGAIPLSPSGSKAVPGGAPIAGMPAGASVQPGVPGVTPGVPSNVHVSGQPAAVGAGKGQAPAVQAGGEVPAGSTPATGGQMAGGPTRGAQPTAGGTVGSQGQPQAKPGVQAKEQVPIIAGQQQGGQAQRTQRVERLPDGTLVTHETEHRGGMKRTSTYRVGSDGTGTGTTRTELPDGSVVTSSTTVAKSGQQPQAGQQPVVQQPRPQQSSAMKAAATAAIAAFMAASDNPVVSGVGTGIHTNQQLQFMRGMSGQQEAPAGGGGTPMFEPVVVTSSTKFMPGSKLSGDAAMIDALDSETAQIEAQIEALKAQTMTSLAKKKSLPPKHADELR